MRDTEEKQIIIDAVNVRYSYEENASEAGAAEAVRGVSMQVYRGEFLCVLGHNGSGKSTLAKLLNGLFTPTSGSVTVCGMNTNEEDKQLEIRKSAGMVFQNPDNQLVATIVEEDVAFGPENLGVPQRELRQRVDEALAAVNMSEFARSSPHKLSGGQKQRAAVARAIITNPRLILADEPTGALDSKATDELLRLFREINQSGQTILMVTHSVKAASVSGRVLFIKDGEVFHQLYRGQDGDEQFYQRITDTLTLLVTGGERI